jgi:nitrite reductase/ring-hydroxylating ferredoxin subunit/uncharacterized membrane protein
MANSVITTIQEQDWLQPVEDALDQGLEAAFAADTKAGKPVQNALHGTWLGHPVHSAVTDVPVGAWTVMAVLDLLDGRRYREAADVALKIGIAGALVSAITGLTDWKDLDKKAKRAGVVHGLMNTAALGLFIASAARRKNGTTENGRLLSTLGYGIAFFSAWLGGDLVYQAQAGVARKALADPPENFTDVADAGQLEESRPFRAESNGFPIVLVRQGDRVFALAETCTHLGGPLSEGAVEGDAIRCPWHGSLFKLETGEVVESPAIRPQCKLETRIENGRVLVRASTSCE